ncbi:MAG: MFS transporter, partial [Alphaproteobacteria bacterium]|nr:MFS transporter [Alphaproteobacteria bacterium]
ISEGTSYLSKLLSGVISDQMTRRKPLVVIGITLTVISRILLALSPTYVLITLARIIERLGNGIQSTPRDAMVGDIAPPTRRGESYGMKRAIAQGGSLFGAFLAYAVMVYTNDDYISVFYVACIPSILSLIVLIFFVKENKASKSSAVTSEIPLPETKRKHPIRMVNLKRMGRSYWMLMFVASVFFLARFGETFMTLHADSTFKLAARYIPMVMVAYNAGHCLISYPAGYIADRMNRYWVLAMGILMLVLSDVCLATATGLSGFFLGAFLWGVQFGITQNVFTTLIAETVPEDLRGTGFGVFYIICALSAFFADTLAGQIAHNYGIEKVYIYGCVMAIIAL